MKTALTIAGFDPSSGAGITADLMVFAAHGHFGTSAITSLTVQSTLGVRASQPVPAELLRDTLDCLHEDLPPDGVKIGMLDTAEIVATLADYLERLSAERPGTPIVLDPVLRSSSGRELLSAEGLILLRDRLLPLVGWITPNLDELSLLTGLPVTSRAEVEPAASALQIRWPQLNVLATGGHLPQPDDLVLPSASSQAHWIPGEMIESRSTHGTGCALSSALLSRLLLGDDPLAAATQAKHYVAGAIREANPIGHGRGPLNHLWVQR
ncbi:MAG: bifunctional hydroxymethylpyrimidine kinase/phosphomethylpyrimidine kinase [Edaphobacter sp.]|uniref:bifunctional hydroxymethylpyrimidine kinase/phosphomethylpyrimidine kinase n=1 Tax=Edaphobacter sp. TaxID=1934404 RepID=UPI0023A0FF9D|nr:bifunctional hydroxymethylpyrimidine kinase/phosphomethylpyrimidine kinase [Edaphobacter sp.]MDE1175360.1 bifunctional hydroxymethylpyrimidine kinase/phosphomethylpyrimidine kinase [Edaphobacter sp.]